MIAFDLSGIEKGSLLERAAAIVQAVPCLQVEYALDNPPGISSMPSLRLRSESVAWRAFQGEGTLVHLERDEIHSVNAAATLLIERLKEGATVEQLTSALCEAFEVDQETARRDALAFVAQLRETEVVEDVDSRPGRRWRALATSLVGWRFYKIRERPMAGDDKANENAETGSSDALGALGISRRRLAYVAPVILMSRKMIYRASGCGKDHPTSGIAAWSNIKGS